MKIYNLLYENNKNVGAIAIALAKEFKDSRKYNSYSGGNYFVVKLLDYLGKSGGNVKQSLTKVNKDIDNFFDNPYENEGPAHLALKISDMVFNNMDVPDHVGANLDEDDPDYDEKYDEAMDEWSESDEYQDDANEQIGIEFDELRDEWEGNMEKIALDFSKKLKNRISGDNNSDDSVSGNSNSKSVEKVVSFIKRHYKEPKPTNSTHIEFFEDDFSEFGNNLLNYIEQNNGNVEVALVRIKREINRKWREHRIHMSYRIQHQMSLAFRLDLPEEAIDNVPILSDDFEEFETYWDDFNPSGKDNRGRDIKTAWNDYKQDWKLWQRKYGKLFEEAFKKKYKMLFQEMDKIAKEFLRLYK